MDKNIIKQALKLQLEKHIQAMKLELACLRKGDMDTAKTLAGSIALYDMTDHLRWALYDDYKPTSSPVISGIEFLGDGYMENDAETIARKLVKA